MATSSVPPHGNSAKCYLLDAPPEIRNTIYELTFAPDTTQIVELLTTEAPSKALALTCRQIYEESRLVHRAAYRNFWRQTDFVITIHAPKDDDDKAFEDKLDSQISPIKSSVQEMSEEDVENISRLRIELGTREWELSEQLWLETRRVVGTEWLILPRTHAQTLKSHGHDTIAMTSPELVAVEFDPTDSSLPSLDLVKELVKGRKITIDEILGILSEVRTVGALCTLE